MFTDRIEGKWVDAFRDVLELCKVTPGELSLIHISEPTRPY